MRYILILSLLCVGLQAKDKEDFKGKTFYTTHTIWTDYGVHRTVNYLNGIEVPVNTKVTVQFVGRNRASMETEHRKSIFIKNERDYSGLTMLEWLDRYLSETPVKVLASPNVGGYTLSEESRVSVGHTKEQVLQLIGYPPVHQTNSLENNGWMYWKSQYDRLLISFEADTVFRIKD